MSALHCLAGSEAGEIRRLEPRVLHILLTQTCVLWMVVVGNDGYVDGKHADRRWCGYACRDDLDRVDVIRPYTGGRPDLIDDPRASD